MKKIFQYFRQIIAGTDQQSRSFATVLREYIDKQTIENGFAESTRQKYEFYYNNIVLFMRCKHMIDIELDHIRPKFTEELRFWLHQNLKTCTVTHSSRHIELCKRVMKYALQMEYIQANSLDAVPTKRDKVKEVVCLEVSELNKLISHKFAADMYRVVADLYIFQAYTGLSYGDLYTYQVREENGQKWIFNQRAKNDNPYWVPMFEQARLVHEKYDGKLPVITNQTYNRILKEICSLLNFKQKLTTHTARKTFATVRYNEGWNVKVISQMLGQKNLEVCEDHYILITRQPIENEMRRLGVA